MPISELYVVRHRTPSTVIGRLPLPNVRVTLLVWYMRKGWEGGEEGGEGRGKEKGGGRGEGKGERRVEVERGGEGGGEEERGGGSSTKSKGNHQPYASG